MYFSDAPYFGGAEKYLELLIAALDRDRFNPCVVVRADADLGGFKERLQAIGVRVFETVLGSPYHFRGYWDLLRIVNRWKPDILHINLAGTYDAQASLVAPVARAAGCRLAVSTEHLAMVEKLWKRHLAKRISTLFIHRVISITRSNVRFLTEVHRVSPSRIEVIHNGVDLAELDDTRPSGVRSSVGLADSAFLFAVVGSLIERKGHRTLLDAFASLGATSGGPSALLVVGAGPEERRLRRRTRQLGLEGSVSFLGHREDVRNVMRDIDCLVVPSLMEGMPFVILEAMAASKPVIASRIYGIPEVVVEEETGLLVSPSQPLELCAAMRKIMDSRELARSMGEAGRDRVEKHFTSAAMADRVESVYESLLRPGAAGGGLAP
ncbi:MAG: glycosyltransferase family 4 protein [Candidatus Eiseniibacteriota bacterium]|nr:MAG: glycosyltransferase family 4 protein [Candidatus Eisenbacteria bacterium]